MLTVERLRIILNGLADDVIVAVLCENGCDPHPLSTDQHLAPEVRFVGPLGAGGEVEVIAVTLWQDERIDLASYDDGAGEDDEDET